MIYCRVFHDLNALANCDEKPGGNTRILSVEYIILSLTQITSNDV
jgi:hypothetical protein